MALNINLNTQGTKTAMPVIVDGHKCRIRFAKASESVNDGKQSIKFEYHVIEPAPTINGDETKPGHAIFENIPLYDKNTPAGQIPEWSIQKVSKRMDAFLGTGDIDNKDGKPPRPNWGDEALAEMVGKEAVAVLKAKTGEYEGNEIKTLTFPGDLDVTSAQ